MSRREYVPVRLSPAGVEAIRALASAETAGNLSEMIRTLLGEALAARQRVKR